MKQYFEQYHLWEDFKNGMYEIPTNQNEEKNVLLAIEMLSNAELFLETCKNVLINWPISSRVNLTNTSCNRRAWLGQAACCYKFKVPELCTRIAWSRLSLYQQNEANKIADIIINSFELNYEKKDTELYF